MKDFKAAAQYARLVAKESNRTIVVSGSNLEGWKLRNEDGSVPKIVLDEILERDSEGQEWAYIHSKADGPNADYYREKQLEEDGTSGLNPSY